MIATVLVVEGDALIRQALVRRLRDDGYEVIEAKTGRDALGQAHRGPTLAIVDCDLSDVDAAAVISGIKEFNPDCAVIVVTGDTAALTAADARRMGAYGLVKKPIDFEGVSLKSSHAVETARLRRELQTLHTGQARAYDFSHIAGESGPMMALRQRLHEAAASSFPAVLLTGETGTGKHLAARVLHFNSDRAMRPFVTVECAALPERLLEIELFGVGDGDAISDGSTQRRGLFDSADGGTILLKEIGDVTPGVQARLLRLLDEKVFNRVGGSCDVRVDVRVLASTGRALEEQLRAGRFREDLHARLSAMVIDLPPLRTHREDVPTLISFYVDVYNREFRKAVRGASLPALRALQGYSWPGNVRELRNAAERAMLRTNGAWLEATDFPVLGTNVQAANGMTLPSEGVHLEELERSLVVQALERSAGNQTRAAALLGLNRDQIRYRISKFNLTRGRVAAPAARLRESGKKVAAAFRKISS